MTARSALDRYIDFVLQRRWPVVLFAALVMLAMTGGAPFIGVTNDYRSLFDEDNPQLAALDALEETYSASNVALIAIAPRQGSVFTRETLAAVEALTEAAWQAPLSTRVDSLTNYTHSESFEDDLVVGPLVRNAGALTDEGLERVENIALNAIDLAGRLVSHDGRVAGLAIHFALADDADASIAEINGYLRALLEEARAAHPDLEYHLTGDVVMHRVFAETTEEEARTLIPLVFAIIAVASGILLRSVFGTHRARHRAELYRQHHNGLRGLDRNGPEPREFRHPDHRHDRCRGAHDPHRRERPGRNGAGTRQERSHCRGAPREYLARFPHHRHHGNRISQPERIRFTALPRARQPCRLRGALRIPLFGHPAAGPALHPAGARAPRLRRERRVSSSVSAVSWWRAAGVLLVSMAVLTAALVSGIPRIDLTDNWTRYFDERYEFRRDTDFVIDNLTGMETLEFSLEARGATGRHYRSRNICGRWTPLRNGAGRSRKWCTSRRSRTS